MKHEKKRKCRLCGRTEEHEPLIDRTIDNKKYRVCRECNNELV